MARTWPGVVPDLVEASPGPGMCRGMCRHTWLREYRAHYKAPYLNTCRAQRCRTSVLKSGAKPPLKLATVGHTKVGTPPITNLPIQNGFGTCLGVVFLYVRQKPGKVRQKPGNVRQKPGPFLAHSVVRVLFGGSSPLNAFKMVRLGRDFPHR